MIDRILSLWIATLDLLDDWIVAALDWLLGSERCHRCRELAPTAGRHGKGWRFATCADTKPRWTCPGCAEGPPA